MGVVAVLIKCHEHVGPIAGRENIAGAHAHLKDRRPPRNGGRNRHVGHDVLLASTGKPGEKAADGLNSILRIASESNYDVVDEAGCAGSARGAARGFGGVW